MERLTHYYNGKVAEPYNRTEAQAMAQKLAKYEDAEEAGTLVRLPCKVGDTVYDISYQVVSGDDITPFTIECIAIGYKKLLCHIKNEELLIADTIDADDFGKTVFLTREAAEAALKARS